MTHLALKRVIWNSESRYAVLADLGILRLECEETQSHHQLLNGLVGGTNILPECSICVVRRHLLDGNINIVTKSGITHLYSMLNYEKFNITAVLGRRYVQ